MVPSYRCSTRRCSWSPARRRESHRAGALSRWKDIGGLSKAPRSVFKTRSHSENTRPRWMILTFKSNWLVSYRHET